MNDFISTLFDTLSGGWSGPVGALEIFTALCFASLIAVYIYIVYVFFTNKSFYNRDFNITLVCITLITTGLVAAIQSSLLVSLSVGGALSIIRFRTAIKNSIDMMFLFWSIACGIMCGTGVASYAMILSVFLTILVVILSRLPLIRAPYLLIINADRTVDTKMISEVLKNECRYFAIKSSSLSDEYRDMTIEFRSDDSEKIVSMISSIEGVESVSVLEHNGDEFI